MGKVLYTVANEQVQYVDEIELTAWLRSIGLPENLVFDGVESSGRYKFTGEAVILEDGDIRIEDGSISSGGEEIPLLVEGQIEDGQVEIFVSSNSGHPNSILTVDSNGIEVGSQRIYGHEDMEYQNDS